MSSRVTAKAIVNHVQRNEATSALYIGPDYAEGRNAEWAAASPALGITLVVRNEVAHHYPQGGRMTVTFELDETGQRGQAADGTPLMSYRD